MIARLLNTLDNTPLLIFYSVVALVHLGLTYATWQLGNERKENAPVKTPYDLFHSFLPNLSNSWLLWGALLAVDFVPFLFGAEVINQYSGYFLIFMFLRHIISLLTITGPSSFKKCTTQFSWRDYFFGHCYESGFDLTFAYAVLLGLILINLEYSSMYCYSYIALVAFGLLAIRSVSSQELFVTGILVANLYYNNAPQYLPTFIQELLVS